MLAQAISLEFSMKSVNDRNPCITLLGRPHQFPRPIDKTHSSWLTDETGVLFLKYHDIHFSI